MDSSLYCCAQLHACACGPATSPLQEPVRALLASTSSPAFRPPSPHFRSLHVLLTGDDESKEALRAMGSVQLLVGLVR